MLSTLSWHDFVFTHDSASSHRAQKRCNIIYERTLQTSYLLNGHHILQTLILQITAFGISCMIRRPTTFVCKSTGPKVLVILYVLDTTLLRISLLQQKYLTLCSAMVALCRQACAQRSHAGIVFTQWFKNGFFAPQGRHVAPINGKIMHGGADRSAKFHVYRGKNTVNISNFCQKFVPQGRLVCNIFLTKFSAFVRVYRQLLSFQFGQFRGTNTQVISIFRQWGHLCSSFAIDPHIFSDGQI